MLGLDAVSEKELYATLDWLLANQGRIEKALAQRHLKDGMLVMYDLTSTWFEGRTCPLAQHGHSRDHKSGKLQIEFGLLCSADGCPKLNLVSPDISISCMRATRWGPLPERCSPPFFSYRS